jgi:hypothetical protein
MVDIVNERQQILFVFEHRPEKIPDIALEHHVLVADFVNEFDKARLEVDPVIQWLQTLSVLPSTGYHDGKHTQDNAGDLDTRHASGVTLATTNSESDQKTCQAGNDCHAPQPRFIAPSTDEG